MCQQENAAPFLLRRKVLIHSVGFCMHGCFIASFVALLATASLAVDLDDLLGDMPEKPADPRAEELREKYRERFQQDIKHQVSLEEENKYNLHILMNEEYAVYFCRLTVSTNPMAYLLGDGYSEPETNINYRFELQKLKDHPTRKLLAVTMGQRRETLALSDEYVLKFDGKEQSIQDAWGFLGEQNVDFSTAEKKANQNPNPTPSSVGSRLD